MQNDWYSGDVEAKITFVKDEEYPVKLKYKIEGATNVTEKTAEVEVTENIRNEGISNIVAWTEDSEGNKSTEVKQEIKIDINDPDSPIITVTGDKGGDPEWYSSNITVKMETKPDTGAGIVRITYEITKNGKKYETRNVNDKELTRILRQDGAYEIKAWAIDGAGRTSPEPLEENGSKVIVKKDGNKPSDVELKAGAIMSQKVGVIARGTDNEGSGIYSYTFYKKLSTETDYGEAVDTLIVDNEEEIEYTYQDLETGLEYDFMVEVRDKAGLSERGELKKIYTKDWVAKVGDFVYYGGNVADFEVYDYMLGGSSSSAKQKIARPGLSWRLWKIDEEKQVMQLVSATCSPSPIQFTGAIGYTAAVGTLDSYCTGYREGGSEGRRCCKIYKTFRYFRSLPVKL